MKKSFLLLLLMALLPLAGWADPEPKPVVVDPNVVEIDGYEATLSSYYVLAGKAAPTVTAVMKGENACSPLADGGIFEAEYAKKSIYEKAPRRAIYKPTLKKVAADAVTEGLYYRLVYFTDNSVKKALYVPFYVVAPWDGWYRVNNETVASEDAFNRAMSYYDGAYWLYYQQYPWCDVWFQANETNGWILFPGDKPNSDGDGVDRSEEVSNTVLAEANALNNENGAVTACTNWADAILDPEGDYAQYNISHSWNAVKQGLGSDNIVFSMYDYFYGDLEVSAPRRAVAKEYRSYKVLVKYGTDYDEMPWGANRLFSINESTTTDVDDSKEYGVMSVTEVGATSADFDAEKFRMYMVPAALDADGFVEDVKSIADATVTCTNSPYEYNGAEQKPIFSDTYVQETEESGYWEDADAFVTMPSDNPTSNGTTLVEGVDYEVVFVTTGRTLPGTYNFRVIGIGAYEGEVDVDAETEGIQQPSYKIVGAKLIINPAYTEKTYGQEDSEIKPKFAFDAASIVGELGEDYIEDFLTVQRGKDAADQGEDVGEYKYIIGLTDAYYAGECMYEIVILQNYSILKIMPADLDITVAPASKTYGVDDPAFTYTIPTPAQLKFNDAEKASGTPGETDLITSITRDGDNNAGEKNFAATSKNYTVTVTNKFTINPANNTGIAVTFDPDKYNATTSHYEFVYTGLEQTPAPVVKIGTKLLTAGTDYIAEGDGAPTYANNKNVGKATCTVTLTGNYTGTVSGDFYITPAKLIITANSYNAEPDTYGWTYDGWVNESEGTATESLLPATDFTAPTGVTKGDLVETNVWKLNVKEDATAKNYTFEYVPGLLALNNKPVIEVYPVEFAKTYDGKVADPKDVTLEAYKNGNRFTGTKLNDNEMNSIIFIPGDPIYEVTIQNASANQGRYNIQLTGATVLENNTVHYNNLNNGYTINRKNVTLKVNDATKVYGGEVPTLTATVNGLIEGETAEEAGIVNGNPGYYVSLEPNYRWRNNRWEKYNGAEHVTTTTPEDTRYPITIGLNGGQRNFGNYHIDSWTDGKLSVTPAAVTITADNKTKQFGQADPTFTVTITGADGNAVSNATANELRGYWVASRPDKDAETGEDVGDHTIKVAAPVEGEGANAQEIKNPNYTITFVDGKLTISEASIQIAANSQFIPFGGKINPYDVVITLPTGQLEWMAVGINETEEQKAAREANNAKIEGIVKLSVLPGKDKLGGNKDAYDYELQSTNYKLAENGFTNAWLTVGALKVIPLAKSELAKITDQPLHKVLEAHKGMKVKVILTKREMKKDEWYEWVLPFKVNPRDFFSTAYGEGTRWGYGAIDVLDVAKSQNGQVVFDIKMGDIPANTPFLVKVDEDITSAQNGVIEFDGVTIDADATYADADGNPVRPEVAATDGKVKFVGLYDDKDGLADNEMALMQVNPKPKREFYRGKSGQANMDAFRLIRTKAFLEFPTAEAADAARIFIQEADGTYTAIGNITNDVNEANAEGWYSVTGVKMEGAPTVKGTYIKDGKKVLVK